MEASVLWNKMLDRIIIIIHSKGHNIWTNNYKTPGSDTKMHFKILQELEITGFTTF